jgi:DNA mismatch repair protein MutS2
VDAVEVGRRVYVAPLGRPGIIRSGPDARDEIEVEVGTLRARVPRDALRELPESSDGVSAPAARNATVEVPGAPTVPSSLNIVGQTVDEALPQVDHYLDEAARARLPQVTIIHGKGTGRLRRALHEFLRSHPHAQRFRVGERGEGDQGATVVTLAV